MVSMGSKNVGDETTKLMLGRMVIKAVRQVMEKDASGKIIVDHDFIKVEKKAGGSVADTQFINGVLIDKEISHPGMPKSVQGCKDSTS
jgi:archaeal chaperonin